jgi:alpha-L-fucosidase
MLKNTFLSLFLSCLFLNISCVEQVEVEAPKAIGPVPSEAQLAWHKMEMNAFIHFTINTFTDKEWGYGDESPELFNPSELNVDQWMKTLKNAGFKGVILTAKHHDGFTLYPSEFTEHDIGNSPYKNGKGDLVKDVAESARAHDLKFGIYLSPWDRNRADYGQKSYVEYYRNQLQEVFTNYGPIFEMWFDGANGGAGFYGGANEERKIDKTSYYHWPETLEMVKTMEPNVLFFSDAGPDLRWVGNEKGVAGETNWNTINPDTLYAGKAGISDLLQTGAENGTQWIPAEVDVSIRPGWFYHKKEDSLVRDAQNLFQLYLTSVGRGSTLLLNIPPDRRGLFHENDVEALKGFRQILDSVFADNLTTNVSILADSFRGNSETYNAKKTIDANPETYFATDDGVTSAALVIELPREKTLNYIVLQEYIRLGQRVENFKVSAWKNNNWEEVGSGTTIGHKRILKLNGVSTSKVKVEITSAKASPLISNVGLY